MFELLYDPRALEELARLDSYVQRRVIQAVEIKLGSKPQNFGKPLRGSLKGDWSLRVGDWRVIYRIEASRVIISRIGHRREVYE